MWAPIACILFLTLFFPTSLFQETESHVWEYILNAQQISESLFPLLTSKSASYGRQLPPLGLPLLQPFSLFSLNHPSLPLPRLVCRGLCSPSHTILSHRSSEPPDFFIQRAGIVIAKDNQSHRPAGTL